MVLTMHQPTGAGDGVGGTLGSTLCGDGLITLRDSILTALTITIRMYLTDHTSLLW